MKVLSLLPASGGYGQPDLLRLTYQSAIDGLEDWALLLPGKNPSMWIVVLHGFGATGAQLYLRQDMREVWLPKFFQSGAGILTPHLRGNAWMGPAAAADLHDVLQWMRAEQGLERTLFYSGSMGGTSNLIYAVLHPRDVNAVAALGAATELASYYSWCFDNPLGTAQDIAEAIVDAYGGKPSSQKILYRQHSVVEHVARLTMPVYLAHGERDILMPVEQSRNLAQAMQPHKYFCYHEIAGGNHDSPLWDEDAWEFVNGRIGSSR